MKERERVIQGMVIRLSLPRAQSVLEVFTLPLTFDQMQYVITPIDAKARRESE